MRIPPASGCSARYRRASHIWTRHATPRHAPCVRTMLPIPKRCSITSNATVGLSQCFARRATVTIEYQRARAKEMVAYFKAKSQAQKVEKARCGSHPARGLCDLPPAVRFRAHRGAR